MTDTGQTITVGDSMSIKDAEQLRDDTEGRFEFMASNFTGYMTVSYVNFKKTGGKRTKDSNGAWKLNDRITKEVKII